jgi:hypothetical protein
MSLDLLVYLDCSSASVFLCVEGVSGGEGSKGFEYGGELCFGRW